MEPLKLLNQSYVTLYDIGGTEQKIVDSARVSYFADSTKAVKKRTDQQLINYLLRHWHTSPFEQSNITFIVQTPIFVARQIIRHRTAKINEISGRYASLDLGAYLPGIERLQKQSKTNKQGSSPEVIDEAEGARNLILESLEHSYKTYKTLQEMGLSNELARIVLPVATHTKFFIQFDLHNLMHFLKLRLDSHAQLEIREVAQQMYLIFKEHFPTVAKCFDNFKNNSKTFSEEEMSFIIQALDLPSLDLLVNNHVEATGASKSFKSELMGKLS